MPVSPAGSITLPLDNARKLFADSATFRELMGVATPALAYAKCWLWATDNDGVAAQASYPRAIFAHVPGSIRVQRESTTGWMRTGMARVAIEIECPGAYLTLDQDAYTYISNKAGAIGSEIETLTSNGSEATLNAGYTHLNVIEYEIEECGIIDLTTENGTALLGAEMVLHWMGM